MKKPTVYLDATVISAYWCGGADVVGLARRVRTRDWWDDESTHFALWVSNCLPEMLFGDSLERERLL